MHLISKRERKPDVFDFDERELAEMAEPALNIMFSFSLKTVIVLSGLQLIVVLLPIDPASEVDTVKSNPDPKLKEPTQPRTIHPQFPKKPAKGHSADRQGGPHGKFTGASRTSHESVEEGRCQRLDR